MMIADFNTKKMEVHAVVKKADGTIIDHGMVGYYHRNPIKRLIWRIKKWLHS